MSAQNAVDNVRMSELMNERNVCIGGSREWTNPSKNLVDRALERWSSRKMRADNTSVVIIMLDPPGPPKRDVLKATPSTQSYAMDLMTHVNGADDDDLDEDDESIADRIGPDADDNFMVFDHSMNKHIDLDAIPLPTNGVTVMTRYEHQSHSEFVADKHRGYLSESEPARAAAHDATIAADVPYISSFAESYNTLLNSSLEADNSYIYNSVSEAHEDGPEDFDENSGDGSQHYHGSGAVAVHASASTYCLTSLQTRSELQHQQIISMYGESSAPQYNTFTHSLVDHNYIGESQSIHPLPSISTPYDPLSPDYSSLYSIHEGDGQRPSNVLHNMNSSSFYSNEKVLNSPNANDITIIGDASGTESTEMSDDAAPGAVAGPETSKKSSPDGGIQINEVSSSENPASPDLKPKAAEEPPAESKNTHQPNENQTENPSVDRIVTRSCQTQPATSPRVTRSTDKKTIAKQSDKKKRQVALKAKIDAIIQKRATNNNLPTAKIPKENISIVRKLRKTLVTEATAPSQVTVASNIRTRNTANRTPPPPSSPSLTQRMLRSQNASNKDSAKPESSETGSAASKSKIAVKPSATENVSGGGGSCSLNLVKKQPKRLLDAVQIVKNDNKIKTNVQQLINTRQLRDAASTASATSLRCRMMLAKKTMSVLPSRCNGPLLAAVERTIITRRMMTRLHH